MDQLGLERWDWLLLSVALATLVSLVHWLILQRAEKPHATVPRVLKGLFDNPWFAQPLRLAYAVAIPAALLFWQRALTARGLGLQPLPVYPSNAEAEAPFWVRALWTDWARDLGWAALIAAVVILLVLLGDRAAQGSRLRRPSSRRDFWISLREAVYHQAHWAFYREPFVVTYGIAVGSWLGILPVLVEAVLNPMLWEGMRGDNRAYARHIVVRSGLYIATTLVFLQTQNLAVAVSVDLLLGWLLLPVFSASAAGAPTTQVPHIV